MHTPWGQADSSHAVAQGVYIVSTPSHGGVMVAKATVHAKRLALSERAMTLAMSWGSYYCFEEDCLSAVFFYEQPDVFRYAMQHAPFLWLDGVERPEATDAEIRAVMLAICRRWYPDQYREEVAA